ncbi:FmdB family zinc ribbon protein [Maridesulfovibrio hydrothermalis]|uniref:Regulatory protein, FmdB family n=1 Tax=Maridesulfovibrio hydrothermalis AM13 = DSM 14728 TaxID=1121451 RepID=L0R776_9BACT|nr:FmdB family zinc ribbon protein [Maridesulfovibrio hydrothermalis]CCO22045.1 Regulatory protein, FmdB family [Maridesulfovibrio hydrothermalis AM13 = DSM 14728]
MPIYEYKCLECKNIYEEISSKSSDLGECPACGHNYREKLISSTSSLTGKDTPGVPDAAGTGCCGANPSSKGCIPGSCCGKV